MSLPNNGYMRHNMIYSLQTSSIYGAPCPIGTGWSGSRVSYFLLTNLLPSSRIYGGLPIRLLVYIA
jgi:hypothetical protein